MPKSRPPRKPKAVREQEARKKKKPVGRPAGSRHSEGLATKKSSAGKSVNDPRVGSKKPVQLIAEPQAKSKEPKKRYATPQKELEAIEADEKLMALLDKQDNNETLSYMEKDYLNTKLNRHKVLCEMLGLTEEEDEEPDPMDNLDPINPDDFR